MKVWKTKTVRGGNHTLEDELNNLQKSGKQIKELFPVCENGNTNAVVIVYTEEDVGNKTVVL